MPSDSDFRAVRRLVTPSSMSSSSSSSSAATAAVGGGGGAASSGAASIGGTTSVRSGTTRRSSHMVGTRIRRPVMLDIIDDVWAADKLSDDEVEIARHEATVAPLMEDGELDPSDAIVVSPTGNSASAANNAAERRRREEGWNDLGLDQIDSNGRGMDSVPARLGGSSQQQD
mmetsp:Transcript_7808/g.19469  ORF Transcript_7808/g.19469 Transcript_7808/m.19469 type:complete len:172 (+) Transcript_7808:116-631(+)